MDKKKGEILLKIFILAGFCLFVWWELFYKQDIHLLVQAFLSQTDKGDVRLLLTAIALVPVNWSLETLKWWLLVLEFEKIGFFKALKSVLIGVAIGVFTPGRIGEYGGRSVAVSGENVVESIAATFLGSISQLIATIFFGLIGVAIFLHHHSMASGLLLWSLSVFGTGFFLLLLFLFYNASIFADLAARFYRRAVSHLSILKRFKKLLLYWLEHVKILQKYSSRQFTNTLFTALIRYAVYSLQYLLLLKFMGIEVEIVAGLSAIATVFLLQSSIPLPPVSGLVARGGTALYIWQFYSANQVAILATTFCLWILNVIFPAILGLSLLIETDIFRLNEKK